MIRWICIAILLGGACSGSPPADGGQGAGDFRLESPAAAPAPAPAADRAPAASAKWSVTLNSRPPFAQVTLLPSGPTLGTTPLSAEFDREVDRVELQFALNGATENRVATPASGEILVEFPDASAQSAAETARAKGRPKSKKKKASR
ncbi:MAG: hypothetical protein JXR83_14055 [Deltaproteobacteria bacterium]|nr:hypothetical protein [Deltaproteobacteria bacterium]